MKCRACWADKAYLREVPGWRGVALSWAGLTPLKCHHCYHKFTVLWLFTLGKQLAPPPLKTGRAPAEPSVLPYAAPQALTSNSAGSAPARRKAA